MQNGSMIDPTNINRQMETLILCFEGITGSGKSTLIAQLKKTCREMGRHHDIYIDRYSASLWVYGRDISECIKLEQMIKDRGIYIYLTVDQEIAWSRESDSKKLIYGITKEVVEKTRVMFETYFEEHCILPVIIKDNTWSVNIVELVREIEAIHEARVAGRTLSPFKA